MTALALTIPIPSASIELRKQSQVRVLIFNDTPRNGGPGKVLLHFLRYADCKVDDLAGHRLGDIQDFLMRSPVW